MTASRVIVVTGATGHQGGAILRSLVAHGGFEIRAVTRNKSSEKAKKLAQHPGVTVYEANYNEPDTLIPAFTGAEVVFGLTNYNDPDVQKNGFLEITQGCALANVCKKVGVELFVWSTSPSGIITSGGKYKGPPLLENKHMVSVYLAQLGIKYVDLSVATYFEDWTDYNQIRRGDDGVLELHVPVWKPDVEIGMVYLEADLGRLFVAIVENYRTKPELLEGLVYCVGQHVSPNMFADELRKQTGEEVRFVSGNSWNNKELDLIYHYYNEYGVFRGLDLPTPKTDSLGIKFHTLSDYVREIAVPYCKKL